MISPLTSAERSDTTRISGPVIWVTNSLSPSASVRSMISEIANAACVLWSGVPFIKPCKKIGRIALIPFGSEKPGSYVSLGKDMELTRYRQRVLVSPVTMASILNLNSVLLESPTSLTHAYAQETMAVICQGTGNRNARILLHHKLQ